MVFDINRFADGFKNTINWMLRDSHAQKIKSDLKTFKDNKNILQNDPDSLKALRTIIELIRTNGWRLKLPTDFDSKWDSFVNKHSTIFRTSIAKEEFVFWGRS
ncbi:MAG: hypothetical protein FJ106_16775 [Deltaproteobacteria bacterium]|nr:hypothetical protein [Deltaproteobacteria bacterium]